MRASHVALHGLNPASSDRSLQTKANIAAINEANNNPEGNTSGHTIHITRAAHNDMRDLCAHLSAHSAMMACMLHRDFTLKPQQL